MNNKNIITGIDIGTTKIAVLIAEKTNNSLNILGFGESKSDGLDKGVVVNIKNVPDAPAEVLVEGRGVHEHLAHIEDAVQTPGAYILVKGRGFVEHPAHICDLVDLPVANLLVEG